MRLYIGFFMLLCLVLSAIFHIKFAIRPKHSYKIWSGRFLQLSGFITLFAIPSAVDFSQLIRYLVLGIIQILAGECEKQPVHHDE